MNTLTMDISSLHLACHDLATLRQNRRYEVRHLLTDYYRPAVEVAEMLTKQEADWALSAHLRLPSQFLDRVLPGTRDHARDGRPLKYSGKYSTTLAGEIRAMIWRNEGIFARPDESDLPIVDYLHDRLESLGDAQSMALQILMEAALTCPRCTCAYDDWWKPERLMQVLGFPHLDSAGEF